jgi:hypothetical protein
MGWPARHKALRRKILASRVLMQQNWEQRLKSAYAAEAKALGKPRRSIRLPKGTSFVGEGEEVQISLSAEGITANMQSNEAAFEGWCLALRRWCKVEVVLQWTPRLDRKTLISEFMLHVVRSKLTEGDRRGRAGFVDPFPDASPFYFGPRRRFTRKLLRAANRDRALNPLSVVIAYSVIAQNPDRSFAPNPFADRSLLKSAHLLLPARPMGGNVP